MQWSRVKTILIVTLLAANLFMAVNNFTLTYARNYLSHDEITLACASLSRLEFIVEPDVVLRKKPSMPVLVVKSDFNPLFGFAKQLLGNNYTADEYTLVSPAGSFQIYTSSSPAEFIFSAGEQAVQADSPLSFVKHFFTGVSLSGDYRIEGSEENNNRTVITVVQTINHVDVRGCGAIFSFENKRLTHMSGKWIFPSDAVVMKQKLPDAVNALFMIAESNDSILPESKTVTGMQLVYLPSESPALKNVALNPAFSVTFEGGTSYLFDLTTETLYFDIPFSTQME